MLNSLARLPNLIGRPASSIAYVPQIDGLRAIAVLFVLCWHSSLRAARYADDLAQSGIRIRSLYSYVPHGDIGVALFFFISGFIIAKPFLAHRVTGLRQFYLRRFRRIYPPYALILLVSFLALQVLGEKPHKAFAFYANHIPLSSSLLLSLCYLNGLVSDGSSRLLPPAWSLEIEIQFYLLAPLILGWYAIGLRKQRRIYMCLTITWFLVVANALMCSHPFDSRYRFGFLKHLYLFLAGIVAADTSSDHIEGGKPFRARGDLIFAVGLLLLITIGYWFTQVDAHPAGGLWSFTADLGTLLGVLAVYYGAMYGRRTRRLLAWKWLCLIGTMCYSIYLVHLPLMQAVSEKFLRPFNMSNGYLLWFAWMSILISTSIVTASFYYLLVERPFMGSWNGTRGEAVNRSTDERAVALS